ncbi:MAG: hypothetical protein H3Z53_07895 [archaeon]|nr:hypothetical protein [archaeon]MCP8314276.1 hypothetical protein [archaeon]
MDECKMKFLLFSKIPFVVSDPVALIESYCFQSNFYANYDLIPLGNRKVKDVNKIGARISKSLLRECKEVVEKTIDLRIFKYDLDKFLGVDVNERNNIIRDFNNKAIRELLEIKEGKQRIGFSKATKILHTIYPKIIPMIDDPLQKLYRKKINKKWTKGKPEIFIDYYDNIKEGDNWQNLTKIFKKVSENKLALTKVRIFDIIWWSYLKAKKLNQQQKIKWSSIKW